MDVARGGTVHVPERRFHHAAVELMVAGHEDDGRLLTEVAGPLCPAKRFGRRRRDVPGQDHGVDLDLWHAEGAELEVQV
ncbi:hypothetical protein RA8P1_00082 (plasmid) [Variovorax sp. RA8]|nr:hypothetical protein RA8P1_00082 [Variovorax sp. RA8]